MSDQWSKEIIKFHQELAEKIDHVSNSKTMNDKIKTHCYKPSCGPVVKTGFQTNFYYVCKNCKEEVTERLAKQIEEKDSKEDMDLFGFGGYVPNGNDDGFY